MFEIITTNENDQDEVLKELMLLLVKIQLNEFEHMLDQLIELKGPVNFVQEVCAPLTQLVGVYWQTRRLSVYQEHLYTQIISKKLKTICIPISEISTPVILTTTLPGEHHYLGILMAEVFFKFSGCKCLSLGPNTPISEIVKAVEVSKVDVLALSFSKIREPKKNISELSYLLKNLPNTVELWIGGDGVNLITLKNDRIKKLTLSEIEKAIENLKKSRSSSTNVRI